MANRSARSATLRGIRVRARDRSSPDGPLAVVHHGPSGTCGRFP
jgi:hypothetical protein